jgi:amino acid transporter
VSDDNVVIAPTALSDEQRLHQMGYAQELHRGMSKFSNFAISFTIISILSGCLTLYSYGLYHGGPPVMIWGWAIVGLLVLFAGLSMAEICSAFPTAGGLYYWSAKLAPGKSGPIWSWFTGWFNLLGQVAVSAGITFGCGYSVGEFIYLVSGNATWTSNRHVVLLTAILLLIQGLINTFGVNIVALFNKVSVWWHLVGVAVIVVLLFIAPHSHSHQSGSFLFGAGGFDAFRGLSGFSVPFYVFLLGLLVAQYTFTGYDASAHVTEETLQASVSGPKGIVTSIWVSWIAGFVLLIGVSAAIPHFVHGFSVTIAGTNYNSYASFAGGVPWGNVFVYATGKVLGEILVLVVIGAQFFCGIASITANSRMIYAFSRDGAVPFSSYWHNVSKRSRVPGALRVVRGRGRVHLDDAGAAAGQHRWHGLRRRDVDRGHRTVRRLPDPGLPATDQWCGVHARAVEARQVGSALRLDRHRVGGHHLRVVHAPRDVAYQRR